MSGLATQEYKFKKGDSLDDIAKKHGLKDGNVIWKFPENKAVASKRGKPDQLQAGDTLVLPPSEREIKAAHDRTAKALAAVDGELARTKHKLAVIDKLINESNANYLDIVKQLNADKAQIKNAGDAADAAAMLASMGKSLATITVKGAATAKLTAAELEKLNKELLSECKSMVGDPLQTGVAKALAGCLNSSNSASIFVGALGDSFDKMTSPSFWASTATQLLAGKGWSEAVTTNVADEIDDQILAIQNQRAEQLKVLIAHRKSIEALTSKLQAQRKEVEAGMKGLH